MTDSERAFLDLASCALDYPDQAYFQEIPLLRQKAREWLPADSLGTYEDFLAALEREGTWTAQQKYVAVFDHDPDTSLYLAWHRYGNDRGQGKALAALNGLYRTAGLEPVYGSLPDYLPRMLEFMAVSEDWAIEVMLDGFGPEIAGIIENLAARDAGRAKILEQAFAPLRKRWPRHFQARQKADLTIRPMARPEPEERPKPLVCPFSKSDGLEDKI